MKELEIMLLRRDYGEIQIHPGTWRMFSWRNWKLCYLVETVEFEFSQEHDEYFQEGTEHVVERLRIIPKVDDEKGKAEKNKQET
jgi:hypothetical protein